MPEQENPNTQAPPLPDTNPVDVPPTAEPVAPLPPEPPITLAPPPPESGLLKTPTPEQLASVPPPVLPAGVPAEAIKLPEGMPQPIAAPTPPGGVFPQATAEQMQRPQPTFIEEPKPVERAPRTFAEMPEKTQNEIKAGWERSHPGEIFDPNTWVETRTVSARERLGEAKLAQHGSVHPHVAPQVEVKELNERTKAEMEAGRKAVAQRDSDAQAVRAKVAAQNADRLAAGEAPKSDDMGYNAPKE